MAGKLFVLLLCATLSQGATTHVVSVGVERYDDARISALKFAAADSRSVGSAFRAAGVSPRTVVVLASDGGAPERAGTRANVLKALRDVREHAAPGDKVVIFFAGHGVEKDGQQYLLTSDTQADLIEETALSLRTVNKALEGAQASELLFLIDACRNDPTAGRGDADAALGDAFARGLRPMLAPQGAAKAVVATLLACDVGQRAYEDPDAKHGAFTVALLRALGGQATAGAPVKLSELAAYVTREVETWAERAQKAQRPKLVNPDGGDMIVVVPPPEPLVSVAFVNHTLAQVVDLIAQQYGAQVVLGKGVDPNLTVTGRLENQPLWTVLKVLVTAQDLTVRREGKTYVIEGRKAGSAGGASNALFNGMDLDGWNSTNRTGTPLTDGTYHVEQGRIVFTGRHEGALFNSTDCGDFHFRAEFRLSAGANSGFVFNVDAATPERCLEVQLIDDDVNGPQPATSVVTCGSLFDCAPRLADPHVRPGLWVPLEVERRGDHVRASMNGVLVLDTDLKGLKHAKPDRQDLLSVAQGRIGILGWRGRSEYRNLELLPLDDDTPKPTAPRKTWSIVNRRLVDAAGKPVLPLAVCVTFDVVGDQVSPDGFAAGLTQAGVELVWMQVYAAQLSNGDPGEGWAEPVRQLDAVINALAQAHVKVVLLPVVQAAIGQSATTGPAAPLWTSPADQARYLWMIGALADRYRDLPDTVVGLSLLADPQPPTPEAWQALTRRAIESVRAADPAMPIYLAPPLNQPSASWSDLLPDNALLGGWLKDQLWPGCLREGDMAVSIAFIGDGQWRYVPDKMGDRLQRGVVPVFYGAAAPAPGAWARGVPADWAAHRALIETWRHQHPGWPAK